MILDKFFTIPSKLYFKKSWKFREIWGQNLMTAENLISKMVPKSDFDLEERNHLLKNYK